MKHRMNSRFVFIAVLCLSSTAFFAQNTTQIKPWYASGLEKLGFTVTGVSVGEKVGGAPYDSADAIALFGELASR
jgi:hypothetical protein